MATSAQIFPVPEIGDQVQLTDEQARAWIRSSFEDPWGVQSLWKERFTISNMVTSYRAGFAAGLEHARKVVAEVQS